MQKSKYKLLRKGIIYDLIGMVSLIIPVVGPFLDLIWAPYAAKKMTEMYSGTQGKIAAVVTFIEELIPGTDFIPSFTLMWLYTFVVKGKQVQSEKKETIEAEVIS
ncbi:hypothetical protein [Aquimarina brevivitae]|uniref:DUF4112 domain-containing protein n=1 Tax=Aquimarina brevivitae TaxID=323412 RepID=A0A4Q7P1Q9_9FLAO|nr:hypothetical protein [Aquimarina brevivitae]RZS93654.1 hypothetical protein EV197_2234 [Aquimarina brevivitae]